MTAWEAAYRSYLERQVERCYRHEVGGIVDLLKIRRVVEILAVPAMSWEAGSMERMQKCATFTLEMRSSTQNLVTTCVIGAGRIDETANVFATVEITPLRGIWDGDPQYGLEDAEGPWVGPMEWGAASHEAICQMISSEVAECTSTMVGYGDADEFTVVSLDWDLNLTRYTAPEDQTQARLALRGMVVQPGDPELEYESDCETGWTLLGMEAEGETAPGPSSWRQTWRTVTERMPCRHRTDGPAVSWGPYEDPEPTEAWYLDCWTMEPHGDVVAVWEQEGGTTTLGTSWEETRFVLRHTPRH